VLLSVITETCGGASASICHAYRRNYFRKRIYSGDEVTAVLEDCHGPKWQALRDLPNLGSLALGTFFFTIAAVFLLVAAHPFLTYPLSLMAIGKIRSRSIRMKDGDRGGAALTYSICLCAYNEAPILERTISNLLRLRESVPNSADVQILLYIDGANDGTAEIAKRYAAIIDVVVSSERRGKSHGLNLLARRVRGEIVVLMDANTVIAPDALIKIGKYFTDQSIGCVCGNLVLTNPGETATAHTGSAYWRLEERIKKLESNIGSVMGADGSLYAIRRESFREIPFGVADDMYLSLAILCDGLRIVRAPDVCVYERSASSAGEEFKRKIRIACQGFSAHRLLWPHIRRLDALSVYEYCSHKLLRWFVAPVLLGASLLALAGIAVSWGAVWAGASVIVMALMYFGVSALGLRFVQSVTDTLRAFIATAIGVYRSLGGTIVDTWEPAASVRRTHGHLQ
jgi:cellulose synthase/poly-beta-1,6-N-acetylglucosamine synthase-like glycosyltransferase